MTNVTVTLDTNIEPNMDEAHRFLIHEKLQPFKFKALAATPGKSLNNRNYSREVLSQAAPLYKGKPFIMDHDIESSDKVIGIISDPKYGVDKATDGTEKEGLWVEGVGLMSEDLFQKVNGAGSVPPLIRGVSIGGEGEGEYGPNGVDLHKFLPEELSLTAFPGIPSAHIAQIEAIRESYRKMNEKESKIDLKETKTQDSTVIDVSLEEAKKMKVAEGPLPTSPDSKTVTNIPVVPDIIGTRYVPEPSITTTYTGSATPPAAAPPTDIPRANNVAPPKTVVPKTAEDEEDEDKDKEAEGATKTKQSEAKTEPKTVETRGFTSPNMIAPMEISSQQANVVARAYDLLLEEQQKGNYGFLPPDKRAWIRAQFEILRERFGRD